LIAIGVENINFTKRHLKEIQMIKKYLVILLLLYGVQSKAQTWNLVWSDEFDGTSINKANWTYDIGGNGWGNSELQYYTNRIDNSTVKDGNLLIIAKKESYGGKNYTSARLKTQGLQSFTYGKIEGRMKFPKKQGIWPAFWALGNNINQVSWPKCGEIDILEHVSLSPTINGTIHWDNSGHSQYGGSTACSTVADFHLYGIEWDAKSIKWFLDGKKYFEANIANNINSTDEFHAPFFFILNLAVGGVWPGNPDATTTFPDTLYVDYIRVYQLGTTSAISDQKADQFSLGQNYPNPFKSKTSISYQVPTKSYVSLKVFNLTGGEVSSIISEEMQAGKYIREWDGSDFPAGIYYCQLKAGSFVETKKFILLK
jgi:beta-glucanase (GH16 family)